MKRKFFMILALSSIFSSVIPVSAQTDKEILFRDIPWGTNFDDTCTLYQKQTYMAQQWKG